MKKRLLTILMAVSLMATALTACGGDDADKEDEKVESVEDDDTEADEAEEAEENEGELEVKTEEPGDDGMIEVEGEVTVIEEDEEEVTPAESEEEEVTPAEPEEEEVTPAEPEEEDADSVTDSEWANAYDDYFSREGILSEKLMISMSMEESGMVFDIAVGVAGEEMFMSYDFGTAGVELYLVDKVLYAGTKMEGVESWIYAPVTEGSDAESMFDMTDTGFTDVENATSCTYGGEVEENGIVYDILDVVIEENGITSLAAYYVNRETQKIEKCVVEQDGVEAECFFTEIEEIVLPAEAANAVEGTEEEVFGALLGVMFMAMSGAEY